MVLTWLATRIQWTLRSAGTSLIERPSWYSGCISTWYAAATCPRAAKVSAVSNRMLVRMEIGYQNSPQSLALGREVEHGNYVCGAELRRTGTAMYGFRKPDELPLISGFPLVLV